MELPVELTSQLRPSYPKLRLLLCILRDDPRDSLSIDDILIGLYLLSSRVQKRSTVTQQLYFSCQCGFVRRVGRGRYGITPEGVAKLKSLLGETSLRDD